MPEYMLDTDTVSFALRGQNGVAESILARQPSQLCISSITLAELRYGAGLRDSRKLHRLISTFVGNIEVVPFDAAAADKFSSVAIALTRRGEPIGTLDTLLAAHALSIGATFVTNNLRHFTRVPGLSIENWSE